MVASPHRRLFLGLFWGLLALTLLPLWGFTYFPTQDGPSHLYNAWLLLHLHDPALPAVGHYYVLNAVPSPNWIAHLVLAGLMLVVKPLVAEKILVSLYLVGLPLAARYAMAGVRRSAEPLCLLVFPLSYNFFLHMGFYNFVFCVPLFLVVVGYYWRHFRGGPAGTGKAVMLGVLGLVLYFAHLSGLVMALFVIGGDLGLRMAAGKEGRRNFWRVFGAFVPGVILTAIFLLRTPKADVNANISERMGLLERLMLYPFSLVSYAKMDRGYSALFLLLVLVGVGYVLVRRLRGRGDDAADRTDDTLSTDPLAYVAKPVAASKRRAVGEWALPIVTFAALAMSFVVPNNVSQGGFVFHRMVLFVFLLAILSLASVRWGSRAMLAVQLVAAGLTVAGLGINARHYQRINGYLAELQTLTPQMPAGSTLLYTESNEIPQDAGRGIISHPVNPFLHAGCYLSLESRLVSLDNYEAIVGYFPVLFQPMVDPAGARPLPVHNVDGKPPRITFPPEVPGHVDFMVFFSGGCPVDPTERNVSLQKQFAESFGVVGKSSPGGAAVLYQAKNASRGAP